MSEKNKGPTASAEAFSSVLSSSPSPLQEASRPREAVTIVIFGASGDLSKRKLIPALYQLYRKGFLPERFAILGFSRTPMSDEVYRGEMAQALHEATGEAVESFYHHPVIRSLFYHAGDSRSAASFLSLRERIESLEQGREMEGHRLFYLSVAPDLFTTIIGNLAGSGLIRHRTSPLWSRVVVEKPFGHDLQSARLLNQQITEVLDESQLYRIDHYLGKETVQNILTFRFGNSIFEPLFNHKYVDHVQITVAESLGMEGRRGHYYDKAGAMRDMVQNHIMQLLCLTAMEPPSALEANAIRDEKVKVLRAILPMSPEEVSAYTVRGQYTESEHDGHTVRGYRDEEGVAADSSTESYVAMRLRLDNWRWAGVPFLLRTGKRLRKRVSEVAIFFKEPPLQFFRSNQDPRICLLSDRPRVNQLLFRIQPKEGISLTFDCKKPGMQLELEEVDMDFFYERKFQIRSPEAYERLLLDAIRGDASLFTRSDEVEYAWRLISSIHEGWDVIGPDGIRPYPAFSDGPKEAQRLTKGTVSRWRPIQSM